MICKLATEDGLVLTGVSFGASGTRTGEVVFNTAMTGYQEILTDPSYCGQIVTMTFPLMGNYGINDEDVESRGLFLSGLVVRELPPRPSNHRATQALTEYLAAHNVMGIAGVDTRALTRSIRTAGAVRGVLSTEVLDDIELVRLAREAESMEGANLTPRVADPAEKEWTETPVEQRVPITIPTHDTANARAAIRAPGASPGTQRPPAIERVRAKTCHLVAIDCGIKRNILRHLATRGDRVTVVPANTPAGRIRELAPDGILIGNGPGDPAAVGDTIAALQALLGEAPMLGICLGHQLLALALGARTYKLKFGHHGANVPVGNKPAGCVEITSQNHGFAVEADSLNHAGAEVTHVNLNDQSVEGFFHADQQVSGIQFHPEACPGPNDASHVLRSFVRSVRGEHPLTPALLFARCGHRVPG